MYTIGQVAKFLGMSRDTLEFYEEKELVKPKQHIENGYRKYNHFDIYDLTTVNFYREIDIEIKKIQELRKSKSIDGIKSLLEEKEQEVLEEIDVLYDTHMQEVMLARKNDVGTIPLKEALIDEEMGFDEIMTIADRFDEDIA